MSEALFQFVPNSTSSFIDGAGPLLTVDEKQMLVAQVSLEEVRNAVFSMKGLKAPGPDASVLPETVVYGTSDFT